MLVPFFVQAKNSSWYGNYSYYTSEELGTGNIATKEINLLLTSKKCQFSIAGFQVDNNYNCKAIESKKWLYIKDVKSGKLLGKIEFRKNKYYIYSDDVLDLNKNILYKNKL